MELKIWRNELRKLSEIVDGWTSAEEIPGIERDLVLEKLRTLYDALRFDAVTADESTPAAEPVPVNIDWDAAFPIEPLQAAKPEPLSEAPSGQEPEEQPVAESFGKKAVTTTTEPETESGGQTRPEPKKEHSFLPVNGAEPDWGAEPDNATACAEQSAAAFETNAASEPVSAQEAAPAAGEEPAAGVAESPGSKNPASAASAPQPVAPTLFGPEEATVRHRHKQRVIMSLYGEEPQKPVSQTEQPAFGTYERTGWAETEVSDAAPSGTATTANRTIAKTAAAEPCRPEAPGGEKPLRREQAEPPVRSVPADSAAWGDAEEANSPFEEVSVASGTVLGEVINHEVKTLGDTIAPGRSATVAERAEPVADLRKALGINDRFLLIRDLFDGDGAAYEAAIGALNACGTLDDCMIHIAENYAWNPNSDGAKLLMELLERKYS